MLDRLRGRGRRKDVRNAKGGFTTVRSSDNADRTHLEQFVRSHRGVEGFIEPRTAVSDVTILLVAHDGEWTRRRVPSVDWAHDFANGHGIPSYDAAVVGYPDRMRAFNRRQKQGRAGQSDVPD
jgi:hypothetical protein